MVFNQHKNSPIAIGGLGGSGTRVIAEILKEVGFFLGSDLNLALDNLTFSLLFKRPKWFLKSTNGDGSDLAKGLAVFEKIMTGSKNLNFEDQRFIFRAAMDWSIFGNHFGGIGNSGRGIWPFKRVLRILSSNNPGFSQFPDWGWKEPNTHIYIEFLEHYFENFKYIHVMRHGLDMAFSRNQVQLYNWGDVLGIAGTSSSVLLPQKALKFWIAANERAIAIGQKFCNGKFLAINFDELCRAPGPEVKRIIDFLEVEINHDKLMKLEQMPQKPKTSGRYKNEDLSLFSEQEIQAVEKFGFEVER